MCVIHGHVYTNDTNKIPGNVLPVHIAHTALGAFVDTSGNYTIHNVCVGSNEIIVQYLGYKTIDTTIYVKDILTINFKLSRETTGINAVTINGRKIEKSGISTATISQLNAVQLETTSGMSLGESLKEISGVNTLQTGPSISKPVIEGVYSNRILIMNNEVRQEGQNWGNDHAPEIDPFIADNITVIKGAASIRYGSDAIGGVVLINTRDMRTTPGIDGDINLVGMGNGHIGIVSGMVEGAQKGLLKGLSWRIQGTLKKSGNEQAPGYYIGNTGFDENDYSATLKYVHANWGLETYYSDFNTEIGIATASHVGSLADLYAAFNASQPLVNAGFTYDIARPYQTVDHKLFKTSGFLKMNHMGKIETVFAVQGDIRKEYDADVTYTVSATANANAIPDLYFNMITQTVDLIWEHPNLFKKILGSIGLNFISHGNLQEGTGYQELIPNFLDYGEGIFMIEKYVIHKLTLEAGARYDDRWMRAYTVNPSTLEVRTPTYNWHDPSFTLGALYDFNHYMSANINVGSAWRPPQAIELFADGIHQSAASFEHGDSSLTLERAYNSNVAIKYMNKHFSIEGGVYLNYFHHYIYLRPDPTPAETIDGPYPAFTYTQVNALFRGADLTFTYRFLKHFTFTTKGSIVRATNADNGQWLLNIPADRITNTLKYNLGKVGKLKDVYISLNNIDVARQTRADGFDYVTPPPGYVLWGGAIGFTIPAHKQKIDISLSGTNITNVAYRDYLDRFRYYIDDPGRNISLRLKVPFNWDNNSIKADAN